MPHAGMNLWTDERRLPRAESGRPIPSAATASGPGGRGRVREAPGSARLA